MTRIGKVLIVLSSVFLFTNSARSQEVGEARARDLRGRYQAWEVNVPPNTQLAGIQARYTTRLAKIADADMKDESPYPLWFRAYLRDQHDLPTDGAYQYPRVAAQILEWMVANPDLRVRPSADSRGASRAFAPTRIVNVGTNINITNLDERNSESFIAVDSVSPQFLIAGANNISGSGRLKAFRSSDGGVTWSRTELPLAAGSAFQSDPAVAWTTDGTAFAATLGINNLGSQVDVQVFKSTDRGATWSFVKTVSTGTNNDKELMWVDTHASSPFRDSLYIAWDVPGGGMRFARSTDRGTTFSPVSTLSSDGAIGAHLTTGPAGELFVGWPDTNSRELRIRKSTDGGATFAPPRVIATTNKSFEISIPAMCSRKALIYLALGVDRSDGPNKGHVYAVWADRNGTAADPGCAGVSSDSNTDVFFSRSTDGGTTWSAAKVVHANPAKTDQFNPWMDVDPADGSIHLMFYNTRDDPDRKVAQVYYVRSADGGDTFIDETKITTASTDETSSAADSGNQYGDYNGLAVFRGVAHPVWTDRRSGVPGDKEQIFTTRVEQPPSTCRPPCLTLEACVKRPWLCHEPEIIDGLIILECAIRGCIVIDPIPRNCLVKWECPGCPPNGLCPPFYHIFLEGLTEGWEVDLVDAFGERVDVEQFKSGSGVVLSFRPQKELFIDGQIGDYFLAFRLGKEGKPGREIKVKSKVKMSDKAFAPANP